MYIEFIIKKNSFQSYIFQHLRGTVDYGLNYERGNGVQLIGYTDFVWAGSAVDRNQIGENRPPSFRCIM